MATITVPVAVSGGTLGISAKQALSSALAEVIYQIPPRIGVVTVQVVPNPTGTYEVACTANPIEDVQAGSASWFDIITGTAAQQQAIFASVTAIRFKRTAGDLTVCIRGQ